VSDSSIEEKNGVDFALLSVEDPFLPPTHLIATLSNTRILEASSRFIEAGYGYGSRDDHNPQPGDDPIGVLRKIGDGSLRLRASHEPSLDRMIILQNETIAGTRRGDSGGPLYILDRNNRLLLQGVLSEGGFRSVGPEGSTKYANVAEYSNVVFLKNWILKAASSTKHPITNFKWDCSSPQGLSTEFAGPMVKIENYRDHLREICRKASGWDLVAETTETKTRETCNPASKDSCELHSQKLGNGLFWNKAEKFCKSVPDKREDCIKFSDDGSGMGSVLMWNEKKFPRCQMVRILSQN
jgi:hypothetical protein